MPEGMREGQSDPRAALTWSRGDTARMVEVLTQPFVSPGYMKEVQRSLDLLSGRTDITRSLAEYETLRATLLRPSLLEEVRESDRRWREIMAKLSQPIAGDLARPLSLALARQGDWEKALNQAFRLGQTARLFKDHEQALAAAQRWLDRAANDVMAADHVLQRDEPDPEQIITAARRTAPTDIPRGTKEVLQAVFTSLFTYLTWKYVDESLGAEDRETLNILAVVLGGMLLWMNRRNLP